MKKSILLLFAALLPLVASAEYVEIDGIRYYLDESAKQAEVRSSDSPKYSGSITIPATVPHKGVQYSVTSIGFNAFCDCSSLTAITIPEDSKLTSIGERAFWGCSSLTAITIPEGVTSIGNWAFYGCSSLTAIVVAKGNKVYDSRNGCNAIIETNSNTLIQGCSSTIIPESVTSIGGNALSYCSSLTAINIPEGVTSIASSAFSGCSSLTAITIPEEVTSIGLAAFSGCSSLTAITIPESVTSIGGSAFYCCSSLTSINIPEGVTSIGGSAFYDCYSLTAITLPEGVTSIGDRAFYGCSSLTSITIPENSQLTSIGRDVFSSCSSLTAITIPEGVTSIGNWAFSRCSSLKTVINYSDLPLQRGSNDYGYVAYYADRVINVDEVIDGYAFKTIEGVHYLTGYIGDKTELTLPADYKGENYQIGYEAFAYCSNLTAINIPEGVTSIGRSTFEGCSSLKELTLGKGLKKIVADAFNSCTALEKVTIYATRPPSIEGTGNAFFSDATYENATLYVPQGCTDKYEVMTGWSAFYTIEEMKGGTPNYLTLRQADNGEVGIVVEPGRTYKMRITGATEGAAISIYTTDGTLVAQESAEGSETQLTLPTGQVYIVKVADKVVKIGM